MKSQQQIVIHERQIKRLREKNTSRAIQTSTAVKEYLFRNIIKAATIFYDYLNYIKLSMYCLEWRAEVI